MFTASAVPITWTREMTIRSFRALCGICGLWFAIGGLAAAQDCGRLGDGYGPFDYRTAPQNERDLVEGAHFTPGVESLTQRRGDREFGDDIDYTLRAFPNHARALNSMMTLAQKQKTDKPKGSRYTVGCWLDRAEAYAPDDGTVEVLYGIYLLRKGDAKSAVIKLEHAVELNGGTANAHYNLGLAYFELHDYDKSLTEAQAAYGLGFPLPGLRNKLQSAGKWRPAPDADGTHAPSAQDKAASPPAPSGDRAGAGGAGG